MSEVVALGRILQIDVLLRELAIAKAEVGIEVPVFTIAHACANACIGDSCTALERGEACVIVGSIGHKASTYGEFHLLLFVVDVKCRITVEILSSG